MRDDVGVRVESVDYVMRCAGEHISCCQDHPVSSQSHLTSVSTQLQHGANWSTKASPASTSDQHSWPHLTHLSSAESDSCQETNERLHGLVQGAEEEDCSDEPQAPQLWDIQAVGWVKPSQFLKFIFINNLHLCAFTSSVRWTIKTNYLLPADL